MRIKTVSIDADVEAVLRAAKLDGNKLVLQGQLMPQMYKKVMKVLEQIGFKWSKSAKCHIGDGDSAVKLAEVLAAGTVVNQKQTYQFFETPEQVAARLVSLAGIKPGERVLEPSAGRGAIINAIWACPKTEVPPVLFAIELNPENANFLKMMAAELLEFKRLSLCVEEGDFLQHEEPYDRIVMNPPFTAGQDVDHVRHAYDLLMPGGRLVSVMSPSWKYNSTRKFTEFRDWFAQMKDDGRASVEDVPAGTFKESGTDIATVIVVIQKPLAKEEAA